LASLKWPAIAFIIGFVLMEIGALLPIAWVASVQVEPKISDRVNEAALDWALVTRDPYLEHETVRAFRTDALGNRGPDVAVLERLVRQRLTVERVGDSLRLSVRSPDRALSEAAAKYFGERLRYYVQSPLRDMVVSRREKLGLESYRLRRRLGMAAVADSFVTPAPPTEADLARAAEQPGAAPLIERLRAVEAELAIWKQGPYRTAATITEPSAHPIRRIGNAAAHVMAVAIGLGLAALAMLGARVSRLGVSHGSLRGSVAIGIGAFLVPCVAGALSAALQFESRASVLVTQSGAPAGSVVEKFGRTPQTVLPVKEFPELWAKLVSRGPRPDVSWEFVMPDALRFETDAGQGLVSVLARSTDALDAESSARAFARRLAPHLAGAGALAEFREFSRLPQRIRDAEARLKWHDAELLKNLPVDLRKTHEKARAEDLEIIARARDAIAKPPPDTLVLEQTNLVEPVRSRPTFAARTPFWKGPGRTIAWMLGIAALLWLAAAAAIAAIAGPAAPDSKRA